MLALVAIAARWARRHQSHDRGRRDGPAYSRKIHQAWTLTRYPW